MKHQPFPPPFFFFKIFFWLDFSLYGGVGLGGRRG